MQKNIFTLSIITLLLSSPLANAKTDLNHKYLKFFNKYHTIYVMNKDHSLQTAVIKSITASAKNNDHYLEFHIHTNNPNVPVLKIGKNDIKSNPKKMHNLWLHWQSGNRNGHKEHAKIYPYKRGKCLFFSDNHSTPFFWLMRKKATTQLTFKEFEKYCPSDDLIDVFHPQTKATRHKRRSPTPAPHSTAINDKAIKQIMETLAQQQREIGSLKRQLREYNSTPVASNSSGASSSEIRQLQRQINSLKQDINNTSNTVSGDNVYDDRSLKNRIAELESKIGDMRFETSNNSLLERVKDLERKIRSLNSNSSSSSSSPDYSSDIRELKQKIDTIERQNSSRTESSDIYQLKSKMSEIEQKIGYNNSSHEHSSEISNLQNKVSRLDSAIDSLKNNSSSNNSSLEYKVNNLSSEVSQLKSSSSSGSNDLKYKVQNLESKLERLERNISELVTKLSSMH